MDKVTFRICKGESVLKEFRDETSHFLSLNLLCGELHPALPGIPQFIHFTVITYLQGIILIIPSDMKIIIPESLIGLKLSVIEPSNFAHDL